MKGTSIEQRIQDIQNRLEIIRSWMGASTADQRLLDETLEIIANSLEEMGEAREEDHETENALQESEARYSRSLEAANDGIWEWHVPSGNAVFSSTYYALLGYVQNDFPANYLTWRTLVHPDDLNRVEQELQQSTTTGKGFNVDLRMKTKPGLWLWVSTRGKVIEWDAAGTALRLVGVLTDISEHKRVEAALSESEARYRVLVENLGEGVGFVDSEERFTFANSAAERIFGVSPGGLIGRNVAEFVNPAEFAAILAQTNDRRRGVSSSYELEIIHPDGANCKVLITATPQFDNAGLFIGTFGIFRDITERKHMEDALRESEERFRSLAQTATDAIINIDRDGNIIFWNPAAEKIFNYSADEMVGQSLALVMPERFREPHRQGLERISSNGLAHILGTTVEVAGLQKDGFEFPMELSLASWMTANGSFFTAIARDITERKRAEEAMRNLSLTDELTGLYNRRGFIVLADQQMKLSHRTKKEMLLLFCDVDDLKTINDTLGHPEGDLALIEIAAVLRETFREADILARLGGDEFVVLAQEASKENAGILMSRLQENLDAHNRHGDHRYLLSLSMGIAHYDPKAPSSVGELLVQADTLMYEQKQTRHGARRTDKDH